MEQHPAAAPAPANNTPAGGAPEGSPAETANSQPSSLHQLLQALDRKVRERTQELEAARTQIEHSAQAHRTLLGRLDQELLQPISLISFEAERLLQSPLDGLNEDHRDRLRRIQQASASAMHRLRAIVAPNRPSSAEQPMRIQPASIRTIVEASLRAVRDAALAKNVQIALRNDTQSDLIQADARLVKQILVQAADYCVRQAGAGATVKVELRSISEGQIIECTIATTMSATGIGGALLLLDEPTTGLHRHDVVRLLAVLQKLVDRGHSVVVIEHNLDVLKSADWVLGGGPEAGADGGRIVAEGLLAVCIQHECDHLDGIII